MKFLFFFIYIMGKRKIVNHHLKKISIFVLSIEYYVKTPNDKNFVLEAITVAIWYHIKVAIRVTTI